MSIGFSIHIEALGLTTTQTDCYFNREGDMDFKSTDETLLRPKMLSLDASFRATPVIVSVKHLLGALKVQYEQIFKKMP